MTNLVAYLPLTPGTKKLPTDKRRELFALRNEHAVLTKHRVDTALVDSQLYAFNREAALAGFDIPKAEGTFANKRTTTRIVRELADKVGFLVMPYAYLSNKFAPPTHQQRDFCDYYEKDKPKRGWSFYVMAPPSAYSLQKHLDSTDRPIHVPADMAQAFMALQMSIPVLRAMQRQLNELRDHVRSIDDEQRRLRQNLSELEARVSALEEHAARERVERATKREADRQAWEEMTKWYRRGGDPVTIVIPKGTIADDTLGLVGVSWGDLPPAVVRLLGKRR